MRRRALLSSLAGGSRLGGLHLRWLALGVAGLIGFAPAGGADTYQDWKGRVFSEAEQADPAISGETALSPAGDGLTNLIKYAFGIDPHVENFLALPQIGSVQAVDPATGQMATFTTITRRVSAANPPVDLYFVPELSSDLQVWRRGDATFAAPVTHPPGGDFDLVTSQTLLPRGQHLFLRLRILEGQTLPEDWQMEYFGQTGIDPAADPDGDGQTNFDEFLHGTDPNDYYNGKTPVLEIVSGDDQEAEAGQFLLQPLVVEVMDDHGSPFRNAPVTYSATAGLLAMTVGGQANPTLSIRTDNNGLATVYFVTPNQVDVASTVTAATNYNHISTTSVLFTAATLAPNNLATAIYGATLLVHLDGTLLSWGIFPGDGGTSRDWPEPLPFGSSVAAVSAGRAHLVVLDTAGLVRAWGENDFGQIGDETTDDRSQPVLVPNLGNVTAIAAGGMHTLALQQDQTVVAWGANYYGQLGNGETDQSTVPVVVSGLTNVVHIAGGYERSLALESDGTVWTWGFESQYPDTDDTIYDLVPVQVPGLTNMTAIAAGRAHAVAVKNDGTVWAWGSNAAGQLGNGANTFSATPVQVSGVTNAIHVSSSYDHTLAILSDGTVMAWGSNTFGQLGDGTTNPTNVPVQVAGLTNIVAVVAAESYSMALQADGTIWTWGQVNFEGGLGAWGNTLAPQQVATGLLDENGNGMDDRWELLYFHNLDQTANGDFNGNGISNLDEWLAAKDPTFWDPNNDGTVRPPVPANPSVVLADDGSRTLAWALDGNESNSFIIERKVGPSGGWLEINRTGAGATSYVDIESLSSPAYLVYRIRSLDSSARMSLPTSNLSVPRPLAPSRLSLTNNMDGTVTLTWTNREPRATSVIIESRSGAVDRPNGAGGWTQVATVAGNASSYTGNLDPNGTYRTRTTGPADLTSPPSNQIPQLPTRFAILDLGTSARPDRVANNGTVLLNSGGDFLTAGYRWNLGPLEALSTFGGHAYDMNNDGTVVGSTYLGAYLSGAIWPVGSSSPNLYPDPLSFGDNGYQYAYFLAVNDSGAMYGGLLDTPVAGDGYSASASGWRGKIGTLEATDPDSSSTFGYALEPFKMNNHGNFLGTFIDYNDGIFATTINYQIASFTAEDINDEGMVIGNGESVDSELADGWTDILWDGATAEVIDVGATLFGMGSGTSPQIVGLDHGEQELWEKDPITGDYESTNLNELIPQDSGWDLDIPIDNHYNQASMAMSRNGLIAGRGLYQAVDAMGQPVGSPQKEAYLLLPCELVVDSNRDGVLRFAGTFNDPNTADKPTDMTTSDQPYRFWLNDDDDTESSGDGEDTVPVQFPDYGLHQIISKRNLEDFTRMWIYIGRLQDAITSGKILVGLQWKNVTTGTSPAINIYPSKDGTGSDSYLKDDTAAGAQISDPIFNNAITDKNGKQTVDANSTFIFKADYWNGLTADNPKKCFLFEGAGEGTGELAIVFLNAQGTQIIGEGGTVWLDLKNIKKMYERADATPAPLTPLPYESNTGSFDESVLGYSPDVSPRFEVPLDEDPTCLVFVHGWKVTHDEAVNGGETMFKRIWWQGYKGRFVSFRWPTQTGNDSFNTSEWIAWKAGKSLQLYVQNYLEHEIPLYSINVAAHSMGNVVVGSALKRGLTVNTYMPMQAALPSGCYVDSVNDYPPFLAADQQHATPDTSIDNGYRLFLGPAIGNFNRFVSFFNVDDFALATGTAFYIFNANWEQDQLSYKPDHFFNVTLDYYDFFPAQPVGLRSVFYYDGTNTRLVSDPHETMSFVARSRSKALGAETHSASLANQLGGAAVNLQTLSGFGGTREDHSGQFDRPIQQLDSFYARVFSELE